MKAAVSAGRSTGVEFGPRRGLLLELGVEEGVRRPPLSAEEVRCFEAFDLIYRSLCAVLYNYVPQSGHPGGSISSGRFVSALLFDGLDYDLSDPDCAEADIITYAAGHKALGLYAIWALRDEVARLGAPQLLPPELRRRLRLEDLVGFRRNPLTRTPLFTRFGAKALDGHPTPATPFVRIATGASGVGLAASLGLALAARDYYGPGAPKVHVVEGEGGLTPGRVAEALAAAGTGSLDNVVVHVDWNQSSIDSDRVCRDGETPGDYVQWTPAELFHLHDWNVISVRDGRDFQQVFEAQRAAAALDNGQPTAVIYRTVKGWKYGIEGRASHGAGHKLCSEGFYEALAPLMNGGRQSLPRCESSQRCLGGAVDEVMEECFWEALTVIRGALEARPSVVEMLAARLVASRTRLAGRRRAPREGAPRLEAVYQAARAGLAGAPESLRLQPGTSTTLRGELGRVLGYYNQAGGGAILAAAADLLGSTSVNLAGAGFPAGFYNAQTNPGARLLSLGGICEDGMAGILSGVSAYGRHIGVGSSYGAFLAPLGHIAARLHAIGAQGRQALRKEAYKPFILICAHAGLKTGEDGPTHADPQALQLLQENFAPGTAITLTPWDPAEVWPLMTVALVARPAVIAPFVTRPNEIVPDRAALGLAPAATAVSGVYLLRAARGRGDGTLVLQGSGVTNEFVRTALPGLEKAGIDLNVYYVASAELFDALPVEERQRLFPEARAQEAMGITGFTLPTMYRWIRSDRGRELTLHPFQKGHYPGSGQAQFVLAEVGLDGQSQVHAVRRYVEARRR